MSVYRNEVKDNPLLAMNYYFQPTFGSWNEPFECVPHQLLSFKHVHIS